LYPTGAINPKPFCHQIRTKFGKNHNIDASTLLSDTYIMPINLDEEFGKVIIPRAGKFGKYGRTG
jgi:hypothetical protein